MYFTVSGENYTKVVASFINQEVRGEAIKAPCFSKTLLFCFVVSLISFYLLLS